VQALVKTVSGSGPDFTDSFLKSQLIAYIGNKRRLLPFLYEHLHALQIPGRQMSLLDVFAGSGAVSRLGRYMGFYTEANDWEGYSYILNQAYLEVDSSMSLFKEFGGIEKAFKYFHEEKFQLQSLPIFQNFYSPGTTENPKIGKERLFYSTENAEYLDRVRQHIEACYPGEQDNPVKHMEKTLLLAALIYEAATKANTSGVFKAYHKGFGGLGKDALKRILAPMELQVPEIRDFMRGKASKMDAKEFVRSRSADIAYLDPPYTIHQYGSNYHILNTLADYTVPDISNELTHEGVLKQKAGIPASWQETWSPYCSKRTVSEEFSELLSSIDAAHVLISYNTEGVLHIEELLDLAQNHGRCELAMQDYVVYRGGKSSNVRKNNTSEFLAIISRNELPGSTDREAIEYNLKRRELELLLAGSFSDARLREHFPSEGKQYSVNGVQFELDCNLKIPEDIQQQIQETWLPKDRLKDVISRLKFSMCKDKCEEVDLLLEHITRGNTLPRKMESYFINAFSKFTYKKYRQEFHERFSVLNEHCHHLSLKFQRDLSNLALKAQKRNL
jgi:adenine-specific DNA-methyltransferase